jgi:hypothetical protein
MSDAMDFGTMNATLTKALIALMPAFVVLCASGRRLWRSRSIASALQLLGAASLLAVVMAHICEGLRLFPFMRWGEGASAGHYLDLIAAMFALILLPLGYGFGRRKGGATP